MFPYPGFCKAARRFLAAPTFPLAFLFQAAFLFPVALSAVQARADDYATWAHGLDLFTNTSPDGAYVTSTVRHFPLLVRLTAGNFAFAEAQGKGGDIRFSAPDGSHLPYQIERWDSAAAAAEVWVKLDSIRGNARVMALRMHWGNPSAADSSNGNAVFDSARGFAAVWHLGGADVKPRANSVAGGLPAVPVNYDGDESRTGIIGLADSLDGAYVGDYLDLGVGYAGFNRGFTYSVWANASHNAFWSRLLDMGNGAGQDNLVLQRHLTGEDVIFDQYSGTQSTRVVARAAFPTGVWTHFAITVGDSLVSIYRNGVLAGAVKRPDTIRAVTRLNNYIGKSNWAANDYYQGKIDEARLSRVDRGADWIKLSHANQSEAQSLLSFIPPSSACTPVFEAPKDTILPEGALLELAGVADCASGYAWESVSGPAPRILDPEVKVLSVALPRVKGDQTLRYRFRARYGDATVSKEVAVTVDETIPDPAFTLPAGLSWNGRDSLVFKPKVANLSAIKASPAPVLNWAWTITGPETDTVWRDSALVLKSAQGEGVLKIGLCLDNDGPVICKVADVALGSSTRIPPRVTAIGPSAGRTGYDASGKRMVANPLRRALSVFGFLR
jgi:hypothetical protein